LKTAEIEARYATKIEEAKMDAYVKGQAHATDFVQNSASDERKAQAQLDNAMIDAKAKVEVAQVHAHGKLATEVVKGAMAPAPPAPSDGD